MLYNRQSKNCPANNGIERYFFAILIFIFVATPASGVAQKSFIERMRAEIEKTIKYETNIDYTLTPGFIVGIIDGPSSVVFSFGNRDLVSEDKITIEDIFELGSVTKVLTATLIAEMDRAQVLSIQDNFDALLPDINQNQDMAHYTIEDLLTHHTGLPLFPPFQSDLTNPLNALGSFTLNNLLEFYVSFVPETKHTFTYSHIGYALLDPVLYQAGGRQYSELLDIHLLSKIAMASTSIDSDSLISPGYNVAAENATPVDFGIFNASMGLRSNMSDMLKFIRYSIVDAPVMLWQEHGNGLGKDLGIALGWHILHERRFSPIYIHTGRTLGHTAFLGIVPETKTGVVILANSATGVDDLGLEILRMINNNWKRKN